MLVWEIQTVTQAGSIILEWSVECKWPILKVIYAGLGFVFAYLVGKG